MLLMLMLLLLLLLLMRSLLECGAAAVPWLLGQTDVMVVAPLTDVGMCCRLILCCWAAEVWAASSAA